MSITNKVESTQCELQSSKEHMHTLDQDMRDDVSTADSLAYVAFSSKAGKKSTDESWEDVLKATFSVVNTIMFDMLPIGILSEISEGLRASVDAYAWIRQGVRLRESDRLTDAADLSLPFDEEEQELVTESMNDFWRNDLWRAAF